MSDIRDLPSLIQPLPGIPEIAAAGIAVDVLRLDTLHPVVSGNKWFKLKGHLQKALHASGASLHAPSALLTFGGAWSNHIIATAYAAQQANIRSIGIIRGERPAIPSATLEAAAACGMQLEFITRTAYKEKESPAFLQELKARFPGAYIIPEGGAGPAGIQGSADILRVTDTTSYSHILCAVGTGTMFLGLTAAAGPEQEIIGIPVLKGMTDLPAMNGGQARSRIIPGYHFGGYARLTKELTNFMNRFYHDAGIPSDFVYTGKLFYGALDMIRQHLFPAHSRLLIIHSGGLQGNRSLLPGILDF